jgi:hypothetical protein
MCVYGHFRASRLCCGVTRLWWTDRSRATVCMRQQLLISSGPVLLQKPIAALNEGKRQEEQTWDIRPLQGTTDQE